MAAGIRTAIYKIAAQAVEELGLLARLLTASVGMKSVRGLQSWPPSVDFQTPPVAAPM